MDVAVVGAGYAGLAAALTLARAGRHVAVFEAGDLGECASTLNGGVITSDVKIGLAKLIDRLGVAAARAIHDEGRRAVAHLLRLVSEEGIACHHQQCGRYFAAHTPGNYESLGGECDLLRRHIGIEAEMVPRSEQHREIGSDLYHGGQLRPDMGGLHPALLHKGLLDRALEAGATVAARTPVLGMAGQPGGFTVTTGRGTVRAGEVIVATNGTTGKATPWLRRRVIPIDSQIIATGPLTAETMDRLMPGRRMIVDSFRLHSYFRTSPDGTRILFGGRAGSNQADPRRGGADLYRRMVATFPELAGVAITHWWSGRTGYTFDFLPHIGVHHGIRHAIGFCGAGVVWAPYLGHKAALAVLGSAEAGSVFDGSGFPTRPLYFGRPWFLPAVISYYGLLDRLGR